MIVNRPESISEDIILLAIKGDKEAFTKIYHFYYKRVYFMAIQFFKNEDIANDIVQEVFIKVYNQFHTLKTPKAFSSWLYMITYRQCQNENRKKNKIITLGEDETIEDFPDVNTEDVASIIANQYIKETIIASVESMNSSLRTVATLRFFEELKLEEIADVLQVSKSTVANRLSRIKKIISNDLESKGIQRNISSILITPVFMQQAYQTLFEHCVVNETIVNQTLQTLLTKDMVKATSKALIKKIVLSLIPIMIGISWVVNQSNNDISIAINRPNLELQMVEKAKIQDITYVSGWHNTAFMMDVRTTNSNYDSILVNGVESLEITENGTYLVTLIKEGNIIDQQEIVISTIDQYSPNATGKKEGDNYVLYLTEDLSGINENSIVYYKNDVVSHAYTYNTKNQTITIPNDVDSIHTFYVDDYAGNTLEISVKTID